MATVISRTARRHKDCATARSHYLHTENNTRAQFHFIVLFIVYVSQLQCCKFQHLVSPVTTSDGDSSLFCNIKPQDNKAIIATRTATRTSHSTITLFIMLLMLVGGYKQRASTVCGNYTIIIMVPSILYIMYSVYRTWYNVYRMYMYSVADHSDTQQHTCVQQWLLTDYCYKASGIINNFQHCAWRMFPVTQPGRREPNYGQLNYLA